MHLRRQRREEECWQREQEAAQLPGWWLRCALLVRAAEGGRHLSLPALHQKSGNSTQIMESKEASEAALLPEQIKVLQRAQQLLQPNWGGGIGALALPFISMGKMSLVCSLPTADQGEKCTAPSACVFLLSCCFTSRQLVMGRWAVCQGQAANLPHLAGLPAAGSVLGGGPCCR